MKNLAAPFGATILRLVAKNALGRTVKSDDLFKRDGLHYKKIHRYSLHREDNGEDTGVTNRYM